MSPFDRLLSADPPPFALVHRPGSTEGDQVEVLIGATHTAQCLADLPLPVLADPGRHELLVLVPYRQIAERGYSCWNDDVPLVALRVQAQDTLAVDEVLQRIPDESITVHEAGFDIDDASYSDIVRRVLAEEIGYGEGANFVIKRSYTATIADYSPRVALTIFRRLLAQEEGAYWTFVVHTGTRTLVGATPERHVTVQDGAVALNPISGTYRYPPGRRPTVAETLHFLADRKEVEELQMVVDEELKMMARVCSPGIRAIGPQLREMTRLAHTEYHLLGRSDLDVRALLRETLFVPTVTGSPLENACRVIHRYENAGRGYYSGVAALIGTDGSGARMLDSSVLIRTADIDSAGQLRIGVGATLVRHSNPDAEVAETHAKVAALLGAVCGGAVAIPSGVAAPSQPMGQDSRVRARLADRNRTLARFWLDPPAPGACQMSALIGRRVLVIDAEDAFTAMLSQQLSALGLDVTVRRFDEPYPKDIADLVVVGPGPGDPREENHPKIRALRRLIQQLRLEQRPFLAVCLGHQILAAQLGLPLVRRTVPNQGRQREIDFFGRLTRVGFYNTFAAVTATDRHGDVEICRDPLVGEVHALRGPGFASVQFHPESLLTEDGIAILGDLLISLISARLPVPAPGA